MLLMWIEDFILAANITFLPKPPLLHEKVPRISNEIQHPEKNIYQIRFAIVGGLTISFEKPLDFHDIFIGFVVLDTSKYSISG